MTEKQSSDPGQRALRDRIARKIGLPQQGPARIGRFVVTGRLGSGGMGVVYRAFDPDLDREVAIKLLESQDDRAQDRLVREAQAMARLGHPNVVAIHEVGRHEGAVYIAMELVSGGTLSQWLEESKPEPDSIVEMFSQAGRGLHAAHEAGLVHRDFKPDNVLVGSDGRARVGDFGLARASSESIGSVEGIDEEMRDAKLAATLSRTGAVAGTPRYMSPEQFAAKNTDARTDQFSFCVALWEALCGEAPFEGDTLPELADAVLEGRRREPPAGAPMSIRIRRVLERGLSTTPRDRFPSMEELRAALRPQSRGRGRWGSAAAVMALGGVGIWVAGSGDSASTAEKPPPCPPKALGEIWDASRRAAVSEALTGLDTLDAAADTRRVLSRLDAFAQTWQASHQETCQAHRVQSELSEEGFDLTMRCLDLTRTRVGTMVETLDDPSGSSVQRFLVSSLPDLEGCRDVATLRQERGTIPEGAEAEVATGEAALARAEAYTRLRRFEEAVAESDTALAAAERTGYEALRAKALFQRGLALWDLGKMDEGWEATKQAALVAYEIGDDATAARIEAYRAKIEADKGQAKDALATAERAEALAVRSGLSGRRRATLLGRTGSAYGWSGRHSEARERFEEALTLYEKSGDQVGVANANCNIGVSFGSTGHPEDALPWFERCQALRIELLGVTHPDASRARLNYGMALAQTGHLKEARAMFELVIAAYAERSVEVHPDLPSAYGSIANTYEDEGKPELAIEPQRKALEISKKVYGPDNVWIARDSTNLANLLRKTGKPEEALPLHERALEILGEDEGPPHVRGDGKYGAAQTLRDLGRLDEARTLAREALAEFQKGESDQLSLDAAQGLIEELGD